MDRSKINLWSTAALAAVLAGGIGYWWSASVHEPELVEVTSTACGVAPATARFDVPLQTAVQAIGQRSFIIGPVDMPQAGGILHLRFDGAVDGKGREVRLVDGTLHLPTTFGRDNLMPERVTLTCRDGAISSVRYQADRRSGTTFTIVHEETAALAPAPEPAGAEAVVPASLN